MLFDVSPVQLRVLAIDRRFNVADVLMGCANNFITIKSSAEHVRISTPPLNRKRDARLTADSSYGSAPMAMSIPTLSFEFNSKTRVVFAKLAWSAMRGGNFAESASMNESSLPKP
jgi:hypothetical protein